MPPKKVFIPTVNDSPYDYTKLFEIWGTTNGYFEDIQFDFSCCNFLRPNAVAFLGGLTRFIQSRAGTVRFDWTTLTNGAVRMNLCQNGFAGCFGYPSSGWDGNSIPYREDRNLDMNGIMDYLTYNWIGKGWVHVSELLRDAITGRMWEIYINAFEHSGTSVGVTSCGQYFKNHNALILTAVDFGQGIPAKIRSFFQNKNIDPAIVAQLTDAHCLKWAFGRGHSTCTGGVPRGLGLDFLKEFVKLNQGKLEIYSNQGYALVNHDGENYFNREISFEGTVVQITLRCDETLYKFRSETL